jgi:hypothetical protein
MLQIEDIRRLCTDNNIVLTEHLIARMRQREIKFDDIKNTIKCGKIIEQYQTDYPFPSCLINWENIHVVCSVGNGLLYIITAYRPSKEKWEDSGDKRKGGKQ